MTLDDYLEPRVFRSPYLKRTESVSAAAALWALLLGPVYYWRKQAPVEALVLSALDAALLLMPASMLGLGSGTDLLGLLVWLIFGLGAPILLPMCYRRKGWVEIGRSAEARWLSGEYTEIDAPERMDDFAGSGRSRMTVGDGRERNRYPLR